MQIPRRPIGNAGGRRPKATPAEHAANCAEEQARLKREARERREAATRTAADGRRDRLDL
jgi:hypothetical protein